MSETQDGARMSADPVSTSRVAAGLAAAGLAVATQEAAKLAAFLNLLGEWNRVYNLTAIRSPRELIERHLVESLALAPLLAGGRIADIGSGAGLPGLPLAIVEPARRFTLIESRAKRCRFLRHVSGALALGNVRVAECRAENLDAGEPFETVLARAVAKPAELLELSRPLTRPGSRLVLLTSGRVGATYAGLAADFTRRPTPAGPRMRSSVVVLERTA